LSEPRGLGRPLSILQVLEKNRFNTGSVHQMFQAAQGLAERGHRVAVVSRAGGDLGERCLREGLEFVPLPLRSEADIVSALRLARAVKDRTVDVVHVHKGIAHSVALVASFVRTIPCFVVNRGVSFPLDVWMRGKYRLQRVHRIVTVCEDIRRVIIASGRLPADKVVVVHAGVDLDRFDPDRVDATAIRYELAIPRDAFLVNQIGAREWKGWRYLLEAMVAVVAADPRAHLLLVACKDQAQIDHVRAEAERLGIGGHVTATGYRHDVPEISAALDVAVDLSYEGLGITGTLREAMAMRKPVVCSSAGGNPELVVDGVTGRLVPPRDVPATAAAIIELMRDADKAATYGAAGRARVEEGFSKKIRIDRLEHLYRRVLVETARGRKGAGET
jgi:glycosyltransferase involved in cell wall biosynthesis